MSIISKKMQGHEVTINTESKVLIMDLDNSFRHAREKLGWDEKYGDQAFGINREIVNFVIGAKFKLLVRFGQDPNNEYWLNYDRLRDFKKSTFCLTWVTATVQVHNIPVMLFTNKPVFSGASN